jgi:predicted dehydrogenase
MTTPSTDRRDFLKAGAVVTAATAAANLIPSAVHAAGNDAIKIGLIGCGGRGSGALGNNFEADKTTQLHAIGDVFPEVATGQAKRYAKQYKERVNLGDRVFSGLDAYKKVIDSGVDLIILATPPGFRPIHLDYAIKAKKHVFCEKPVAVDGAGIKKVLALVEEVKRNNTALVAGTQRRHQAGYIETVKRIKDGGLGDIVSARCSWNGTGIWFKPRKQGETDAQYQIRNWYHFRWICGDHIVEQHVHNLDVINWVMGAHPLRARAFGGRCYRPEGSPDKVGNIWDHFAVEFEYPNGIPMYSYCTHIPGIKSDISEEVYGSKGSSNVGGYRINKKRVFEGDEINPYVQEHIDLLHSIRSGKPLNELQSVAESTMTAILGREAAYSGQVLTWEQVLNAKTELMPKGLTMDSSIETPPVPRPNKYKVA